MRPFSPRTYRNTAVITPFGASSGFAGGTGGYLGTPYVVRCNVNRIDPTFSGEVRTDAPNMQESSREVYTLGFPADPGITGDLWRIDVVIPPVPPGAAIAYASGGAQAALTINGSPPATLLRLESDGNSAPSSYDDSTGLPVAWRVAAFRVT